MKFEVGKKYRYSGGPVETCLAVTEKLAWLSQEGYRGSIVDIVHDGWEEVKEPRKLSAWVNVYGKGDEGLVHGGILHSGREKALAYAEDNKQYIDTIEITYTEKV